MQIDSKLSTAKFDSTVEGTVVSIVDKDEGVYVVQIQNAKFEAYAQGNATYYEGEVVYVNIPRNDYSQQKFITGRKSKVDEDGSFHPFNFRYPFDNFIPLQNLSESDSTDYLSELMTSTGLQYTANKIEDGCEPNAKLPDVTKDPNIVWHWTRDTDQHLIGTTLGIEMNWQTFLGEYQLIEGDYGLRFLVRGMTLQEDGSAKENVIKEFFFKTANMYGNPYTFYTPYTQQALINLSEFNVIDEIAAYFWQDHNFTTIAGIKIAAAEIPNICLSHFKAQYGLNVDEIDDEKLYVYTYDSLTFGEEAESTANRALYDTRSMNFAWVHRVSDTEFTVVNSPRTLEIFNENIEDEEKKAHIYWYRQTRSGDNSTGGVPYVAPGATQPELEARIKALEEEKKEKLQSIQDAKDTYSSEGAYQTAYNALELSYDNQLKYLDELLHDEKSLARSRIAAYAGYDYTYLSDFDDAFTINCVLDASLYRERFRVVVAWEGTYEVSEPLVFQNVRANIDSDNAAAMNPIVFRLLRTETYKDSNEIVQTKLVEDNSIANFFVYDENNSVIKNDDEVYYSDIYYYIQVWIYSYEHEQYEPLIVDGNDKLNVEWHGPRRDTMIREISKIDESDLKYASTLIPGGKTSFNNIEAITRKFKIDSFWNLRYSDNIISAIVTYNSKQYNCQQLFQFGQSGSTGTKYTLRVNLVQPANYMMLIHKPFDIEATIYDQAGNKLESPLFTFTYTLLNDGPCQILPSATADSTEKSSWISMSSNGYSGNSIHGILLSNYPPIFKVTCDLHDPQYKYEIEHVISFMCCGDVKLSETFQIGCPNRIEYKSDGTIPYYDASEFEVREISSQKLYYPTWELEQFQKNTAGIFYKVPDSLLKYVKLDEIYNEANKINPNTENPTTRKNQDSDAVTSYYTYKLNPYATQENEIKDCVAFFWDDVMVTDQATFIRCFVNGVWVCQAIAFAHNIYSSSLLNSWDGQLLIDKEKNAILARMLSAGTKDTRNRFTGVIMGDWSDYGDDSIEPIGLYGFAHGTQTFGFKTDGTGFIGAAGYGQIKFDGIRALISDYYHDHYINLNPQYYSVDENGVIQIDSGSYSQYFLYAKNKKLNLESTWNDPDRLSQTRYGWINTSWADEFENDAEHDYFVVDPNNGVYMSGGIIARYGMLGKCLQLSSSGLTYQKNNGIIFIGQERARDGSLYYLSDENKIEDRPYDEEFWYDNKITSYGSSAFDFSNSHTIGRYIFWAGTASSLMGVPDQNYKYPNFGIEHNGTVHMNNAYVQGDIKAKSLQIVSGDGEYHDINDKFDATYYSKHNPANLTSHTVASGICHHTYGDLLHEGDLWYNTSHTGLIYDVSSYNPTINGGLNTSVPASTSSPTLTTQPLTPTTHSGYKTYRWVGFNSSEEDAPTEFDDDEPFTGWEEVPALAIDTIDALSDLGSNIPTALNNLAHTLLSDIANAYDSIRNGMSPVSFYNDGNCLVNISQSTAILTGIGTVPPGISIYQLKNKGSEANPNYVYDGCSFLLNGKRMGFFKAYTETNSQTTHTIPLLAYYDGNLALAGSLLCGLDVTKATMQDMNGISGVTDTNGLYVNRLDGPTGSLILGNGTIQLISDIDNYKKNTNWTPKIILGSVTAMKTMLGENNLPSGLKSKPEVIIGDFGSSAVITLAGFNIIGNTENGLEATTNFKLADNGMPNTQNPTLWQREDGNGDRAPDPVESTVLGVKFSYLSYAVNEDNITKVTYSNLNHFSIRHQNNGLGIQILENTYPVDPETGQTIPREDPLVTILRPIPTENTTKLLIGWDGIHSEYGKFKTLEVTGCLFANNIYYKLDSSHYCPLATQEWVIEQIQKISTKLSGDTSNAQGTANNAYGVAKHHTHDARGLVHTWYTEEEVIADS